jgi:hypothetical protein
LGLRLTLKAQNNYRETIRVPHEAGALLDFVEQFLPREFFPPLFHIATSQKGIENTKDRLIGILDVSVSNNFSVNIVTLQLTYSNLQATYRS